MFRLRARYSLLLRQKRVSREKATRFLRPGCAGQPALLPVSGVLLKLAALRQSQALNPETAALLGALNGRVSQKPEVK